MPFPDPVGNNLANAPLSRPEVSKFAFFSTKVHQATQPGSRFQLFWHFRHFYILPVPKCVLGERMEVLVSKFIGRPIYPEIYPLPVYHPESEAFYR